MKKGELYRKEYLSGLSVTEIAKKYGVSKQAVSQCCCVYGKRLFRPYTKKECIYMHLRDWLNTNEVKISQLVLMLGREPEGSYHTTIARYLTGKTEPRKGFIDKLIRVTGLPYAMLFWEG